MPRAPFALLPVILLAACGSGSDPVGGVSPDEAKALNDAAEMLDDVYNNSRVEIPPVAPQQTPGS